MSEKINELIINVKNMIQIQKKETEECIRQIEAKIDQKNQQIKNIFSENIDSVIEHYLKYQQTISYQKKLEVECDQFTKKIQRAQKLSQYDENLIQRSQKTLQTIQKAKNNLEECRNYVRLVRKAAININEEKYSNAIKIINKIKQIQIKKDTPLKKVIGILNQKITQHLIKLIDSFWNDNISKEEQVGTLCFNKVLLNQHEKANIYQTFFSKNSRISSNILGQNTPEAPMRFLKKVSDDADLLQKYTVRISLQMAALKQVKILCGEMGEDNLFRELISNHIRKVTKKIEQQTSCNEQLDYRKLLSRLIGFLLVRREVIAYFDIKAEEKLFMTQIYSIVWAQSKIIVNSNKNINEILTIKQLLATFHGVLTHLSIDKNSMLYTGVLGGLFKRYCEVSLENYESMIIEVMEKDNFSPYMTNDISQKKKLQKYQISTKMVNTLSHRLQCL